MSTLAVKQLPVGTAPDSAKLHEILKEVFGFSEFRRFQELVCQTAAEGIDALLVMPTGAGKSLCYQLPGLARKGTTLVISPLIALMEDQALKLQALGLRAERIHAGRDRAESRVVCAEYLEGSLDFLFIAPERLGVPGFPEMLARRKPAFIAIDEAHCISQWGHDFRPDYRMLGERLPALRPAPVIALTATATPEVQNDICTQLGLVRPKRFIHGFRRTNIAIEVAEVPQNERTQAVIEYLGAPERRPAIVYASTRKAATQLAEELATAFPCAVYHAGLGNEARDEVQSRFLKGDLEVVVATIAFGMGIDKANVRTVVHTALPGSIEAYYQEIGRAGRDGLPARAVLMWSYADRRLLDFFWEKSYPDAGFLTLLHSAVDDTKQAKDDLRAKLKMEPEVFDRALEKLWIHGGVLVDPEENITRGSVEWKAAYAKQRAHKFAQIEAMSRYAESANCRMLNFVRYFGDQEDSGAACLICDICAPSESAFARWREPDAAEESLLRRMLESVQSWPDQALGRIYRDEFANIDRKQFEQLMSALVRAGLVRLVEESFNKDGREISYRVAALTPKGRVTRTVKGLVTLPSRAAGTTKPSRKSKSAAASVSSKFALIEDKSLLQKRVDSLKAWRLDEARRNRTPAFRILSDKTLTAIAERSLKNPQDLLEVPGMGPKLTEKYGSEILAQLQVSG